jgi:hypothetical protein
MSIGRRRFGEGLRPSRSASGEREERGQGRGLCATYSWGWLGGEARVLERRHRDRRPGEKPCERWSSCRR